MATTTSADLIVEFANAFVAKIGTNEYKVEDKNNYTLDGERVPDIVVKRDTDGDVSSFDAATDCSGWVSYALNTVAPVSFSVVDQYREDSFSWPRAWVYQWFFADGGTISSSSLGGSKAATGGLDQVSSMNDLAAGDILAWSLGDYTSEDYDSIVANNFTEDSISGDSGHILIVQSVTDVTDTYSSTEEPDDGYDKILKLKVTDSSNVSHLGDGSDGDRDGIGTGEIFITVDKDGNALGFQFNDGGDDSSRTTNWHPTDGEEVAFGAGRISDSITIGTQDLEVEVFGNTVSSLDDTEYGVFTGTIDGDGGLIKKGLGTLRLNGTYSYSGNTDVEEGTLEIAGSLSSDSELVVNSGATLAPGIGVGTVSVSDDLLLNSGGTLSVEIEGAGAGAGYDQVQSSGDATLSGATLALDVSGSLTTHSSYTILSKSGHDAATGTFSGAAEGDTITSGSQSFQISYSGGTGNDVVLTKLGSAGNNSVDSGATVTDLSSLNDVDTTKTLSTLTFSAGSSDFENNELNLGLPSGASITDFTISLPDSLSGSSDAQLTLSLPSFGSVTTATVSVSSDLVDSSFLMVNMNAATTNLTTTGDGQSLVYGNAEANEITDNAAGGTVYAFDGADTLSGGAGQDILYGNYGDDLLHGEAGADHLHGGQDNDTIYGGSGNDNLYGNANDDHLYGGDGADHFYFAAGGGDDTVGDFSTDDGDMLTIRKKLNGTDIESFDDLSDRLSDTTGGNLLIDLGSGQTVTVIGLTEATATSDNFSFI